MSMNKNYKKTIVSSALPYVNNVPHLGTVVCIISADVFARYLRSRCIDVISVLGTDEHGTTAEVKAIEEGTTAKELVSRYFKIHKEIYDWFGCSFDCFGRTSSKENAEVTVDIFNKLDKNGYIKENTLKQTFCEKCDRFLSDRFVEGTCPYCNYAEARGDQCESCGKLLNAVDLVDPKCKICKETPVIRDTKHLFIDLPKIEPKLREWISKNKANWTQNASSMTDAWLKDGIKERCITRDLKWGIKVPKKGYENKVFYSWFDAPIGYIGITKEHRKDWHDLWHSPKDTRLVQFMGKDNIPFHTILFPAFLIGAEDNYTLSSDLNVNEYLNYESGKFSKSRNVGLFCDDAMESGISSEAFRYYIMINRPESADTMFTWEDFAKKINNELVANIGNLVNRTIVFINKFFDGIVPDGEINLQIINKLKGNYKNVEKHLDSIKLKDGLKEIMHISKLANQFFQEKEPWKTKDKGALLTLANIIKDLGILIAPFLPKTADSIFKQLNINSPNWSCLGDNSIKSGHKLKEPKLLFNKLEDDRIKELRKKHHGDCEEFLLNLKVAKILEAQDHPDADKLYVLQIDLGSEKRQLVAGVKNNYSKKELQGLNIVVITNLMPAKLRGIKSNGMLLAGDDGTNLKLVLAEKSKPGDSVNYKSAKSNENQITIDDVSKIKFEVKNKKILANGNVLKTQNENISCDVKDGAKVR